MTYKTHWAYMIYFFVLGVYLLTLPKGIGLGDSGTLAAAAANWGIPHPPGFPSYVLLAHWFTYLPWGTVAQKLAFVSVLASVGTVALVANMAGILPSVLLAFSYGFWGQAVNVETYALTNFVIVLVSYLAWQEKPKWWLIGLVLGFGLGLSPIVVAVILPLLYRIYDLRFTNYDTRFIHHTSYFIHQLIIIFIAAGIVAVLAYSYLPIRASQHPFLNWSDPSTVDRFIKHIMGGGLSVVSSTSVNGFTGSAYWMLDAWRRFGQLLIIEFAGVPVLFMVIGSYILWQKDRSKFIYWILLVFTNVTLAGLYTSGNRDSWFITSFIAMTMVMGDGFQALWPARRVFASSRSGPSTFHDGFPALPAGRFAKAVTMLQNGSPPTRFTGMSPVLMYVFVVVVAFLPFFIWFPRMRERAHSTLTEAYIADLYRELPQGAILVGGGETFNSLTLYAHEALKLRPDLPASLREALQAGVTPVDFTIFYGQEWYRTNLNFKIKTLKLKHVDMPKFSDEREFSRILEQFAEANQDRPIFVTGYLLTQPVYGGTMTAAYLPQKYQLEQKGIVYQLVPKSDLRFMIYDDVRFINHISSFINLKFVESNYQKAIQLIRLEYGLALEKQGDYFLRLGRTDEAFSWYRKAGEVAPLYFDQNRLGQKIQMLESASPSAVPTEIQSPH